MQTAEQGTELIFMFIKEHRSVLILFVCIFLPTSDTSAHRLTKANSEKKTHTPFINHHKFENIHIPEYLVVCVGTCCVLRRYLRDRLQNLNTQYTRCTINHPIKHKHRNRFTTD